MRSYILIFFSLLQITVNSQNLVPNPSFENYLECPFGTAELDNQVIDWYSWQETPDFFHECSNELEGFAGVPTNAIGFQFPISGSAYTGLYSYTYTDPEIREYIATPLSSPLVVGEQYYMMFFTSWYDGGLEIGSLCATNHIGLRFFKNPNYSQSNPLEPDNFAHLDYSEVLMDSTNWTLVDGWFTADQPYNWVALGNFFDGLNTEIEILNQEDRCFGIYYIENVCIATDPLFCQDLLSLRENSFSHNSIRIYPNPTTDYTYIESLTNEITRIQLVSTLGQVIFEQGYKGEHDLSFDVSGFAKGLYVIKVYGDENDFFTTKLLIQ
jgi:hypothetical protein